MGRKRSDSAKSLALGGVPPQAGMLRYVLQVFILIGLVTSLTHGDEVTLKCKRKIGGRLIESNEKHIILETFGGKRTIPLERVKKHNKRKVSTFEKYEAKIDSLGVDAKGQIKLAKMCEKGEGWKRAREHLNKALELEPENETIKRTVEKALKELDKKEKKWREKLANPKGIILKVGVKQNLPDEEIESVGNEVKKSSRLLSRISGKELYIAEVVFTVPSRFGDLIYDKTFTGTPNGWTNIPMGVRNWGAPIIVHELGHSNLGLPDDDDAGSGGQWGKGKWGPCIMAHNWKEGFCSACRQRLNLGKRYAKLLNEEIPEPPETKITIKRPGEK